ncbi:hypothetical protein TNCT_516481 [Trichonephila clavata]|uniref:Uncharacterized protein n=1 Tax=Trichonephila clavata TaxID=2740835 RepID=A0A8X6IZH3_TRICU|nr:hypothetical protein TNCT_516481 [Trichonephila clavata]
MHGDVYWTLCKVNFPNIWLSFIPTNIQNSIQRHLPINPLLAKRFQKIRKLKKDLDISTLKKAIHEFLKKDTKDRKEFALYVEENRPKIQEFQVQLEAIAEKARIKARNVREELF